MSSEDDLARKYTPLVVSIASRQHHDDDPVSDLQDRIQDGYIGFMQAAKSYDGDRGASFATHAGIRIRGSIMDSQRKLDPVGRRIRSFSKWLQREEQKLGRPLTTAEMCERADITHHELAENFRQLRPELQFDRALADPESEATSLHDIVADTRIEEGLELEATHDQLAQMLARLPERERLVVSLRYYEDMTFPEIGDVLGVTESRACQLHTTAIGRLRSAGDVDQLAA